MKPLFTPSHKKVLFFDVNQTIVARSLSFEDGFKETWREYTARMDTEDAEEWNENAVYVKYRTAWQARDKMKQPGSDKQELQEMALREAVRDAGLIVHKSFARDFFQHIRTKQHRSKTLVPHVLETLQTLSPHYTLAIISNSRKEDIEALIRRFDLQRFFPGERCFTAVKLAEKKPNASLFKFAMKSLGVSPSQCVMIGNSYRNDICGAWKAGIDAVWLQRNVPKKSIPPRRNQKKLTVIKQFEQLLDLFK
ncbi:HAD family hydrolase [Paenibacillus thalictri]|uniref:HAD family hydrolase n=1 Tax=Paenibacillus thalictri TaxID=2527873 RepID=UPI0013EF4AAB|nr:HAD family hydrolase [Paenibacillus thalictri]